MPSRGVKDACEVEDTYFKQAAYCTFCGTSQLPSHVLNEIMIRSPNSPDCSTTSSSSSPMTSLFLSESRSAEALSFKPNLYPHSWSFRSCDEYEFTTYKIDRSRTVIFDFIQKVASETVVLACERHQNHSMRRLVRGKT